MSDRTPAVLPENEDDLKCLAWAGRGPGRHAFEPRSAAMSAAAHLSLVALLFTAHVATSSRKPRSAKTVLYYVTPLAAVPATPRPGIIAPRQSQPAPLRASTTVPAPSLPSPPAIELPASKPLSIPPDPAPKLAPPATELFPAAATAVKPVPPPASQIRTGQFDAPQNSAPVKTPVRDVQIVAAGFGDSGTAPSVAPRRSLSATGAFGDATGQSAGRAPGAVQASGFGEAAATTGGSSVRASVRAGGFGDTIAAAAGPASSRPAAESPVTAAQILDKPRPAYTDEARRLQIQGAVQLEVAFRASGKIEVLRVVRGLGHGLDESAAAAARGIRFLPAKREGQPVDSTATVHILFQLAS